MLRNLIDALEENNNLKATEIYKEVLTHKIGEALEKRRHDMAKEYVSDPAGHEKSK